MDQTMWRGIKLQANGDRSFCFFIVWGDFAFGNMWERYAEYFIVYPVAFDPTIQSFNFTDQHHGAVYSQLLPPSTVDQKDILTSARVTNTIPSAQNEINFSDYSPHSMMSSSIGLFLFRNLNSELILQHMSLILWKNMRQWINNNIKIYFEMNGSTRLIDYPRIHIFRHFAHFLFTYCLSK